MPLPWRGGADNAFPGGTSALHFATGSVASRVMAERKGKTKKKAPSGAKWTHARIPIPAVAEEAVAALCLELGAPGVQTGERDLRRKEASTAWPTRIRIEAWFPPAVPRAQLKRALVSGLKRIHDSFPGVSPERVELVPFEVGDYGESWRENFPPLRIGRSFLVTPSWHQVDAGRRHRIEIDPGQAFGTGHHSTTRGCLLAIEEECSRHTVKSGLDIGTGSGVLAIALRRLGVPRVVAIDNDPLAVAATEAAVEANDCAPIRIGAKFSDARGHYDLVVANLYSGLHVKLAKNIAARVAPGGSLIISGLLERQEDEVRKALRAQGMRLRRRRVIATWVTLTLGRTKPG